MKPFLCLLFFTSFNCKAQKLMLLDRHFVEPVTIEDTITPEQAGNGTLPIYLKDINSVISTMEWLVKYMTADKLNKEEFFDLKMGNSKCIVRTEKNGHSNKYNIVLNTMTNSLKTYIVLVAWEGNKRAIQRLNIFMDYLKNNSSIMLNEL